MILARPRRPRRAHEWTAGKGVTFIVTLAASRNVTLAARAAGMSRKSAYALKARDSAFADAWREALTVPTSRREGDKADKADIPPAPPAEVHNPANLDRRLAEQARDDFFARLAAAQGLLPSREPLSIAGQARSRGWQA